MSKFPLTSSLLLGPIEKRKPILSFRLAHGLFMERRPLWAFILAVLAISTTVLWLDKDVWGTDVKAPIDQCCFYQWNSFHGCLQECIKRCNNISGWLWDYHIIHLSMSIPMARSPMRMPRNMPILELKVQNVSSAWLNSSTEANNTSSSLYFWVGVSLLNCFWE